LPQKQQLDLLVAAKATTQDATTPRREEPRAVVRAIKSLLEMMGFSGLKTVITPTHTSIRSHGLHG
jgi:hypothetical protein